MLKNSCWIWKMQVVLFGTFCSSPENFWSTVGSNPWMWNRFMGKTCIRRANSMLYSNSQLQGGQTLTATLCKGLLYLVIHPVWCHRNFTRRNICLYLTIVHPDYYPHCWSNLSRCFCIIFVLFFSLNRLNIWLWSAVFFTVHLSDRIRR